MKFVKRLQGAYKALTTSEFPALNESKEDTRQEHRKGSQYYAMKKRFGENPLLGPPRHLVHGGMIAEIKAQKEMFPRYVIVGKTLDGMLYELLPKCGRAVKRDEIVALYVSRKPFKGGYLKFDASFRDNLYEVWSFCDGVNEEYYAGL